LERQQLKVERPSSAPKEPKTTQKMGETRGKK
jgi:hypothetical protein